MRCTGPLVFAVIGQVAACSFLVSTNGLTEEGSSTPATDGSSSDVTTATDGADGGVAVEAGTEASSSDGGPTDGSFCQMRFPDATYCADFDDPRPLSDYGIVSGPIRIAAGAGNGGTPGVLVELPDSSVPTSAQIQKTFFGVAGGYEAQFTVRLDVPGSSAYLETFLLSFPTTGGTYYVYVSLNTQLSITEEAQGSAGRVLNTVALPLGTPVTVWLSVTVADTTWTLRAKVNGTDVANTVAQQVTGKMPDQMSILYGAPFSEKSSPKVLALDDIVVVQK